MQKIQYTIGVTGGSGSGKSYLIQSLRDRFGEDEVAILSQDNYYLSKDLQDIDHAGVENFDLPSSFAMLDFLGDFRKLLKSEVVQRLEYTYNNSMANAPMIITKPAPIVLVEGLFVLHSAEMRDLLDLKVFVEASDVVKVKRRIIRDQNERNYPLEDVLYRYEFHVLPAYRSFIEPYRSYADVIINNESSMDRGLELLTGFIRELLRR